MLKKMLSILIGLIIALGCLFLLLFGNLNKECKLSLSENKAKSIIEHYFQKPSSEAILNGLSPHIIEMNEIQNYAENPSSVERAYRFRLEGAPSYAWVLARVDACGGLELAGSTTGD